MGRRKKSGYKKYHDVPTTDEWTEKNFASFAKAVDCHIEALTDLQGDEAYRLRRMIMISLRHGQETPCPAEVLREAAEGAQRVFNRPLDAVAAFRDVECTPDDDYDCSDLVDLDSPDYKSEELKAFEERGYKRINNPKRPLTPPE